ncbi:hypothetical protein BJV77DRAFT_962123 [Russula vinacea]|nr:hypothetical protein BJV77DRAFT_962123 [Russula vinacea]
MVTTLRTLAAKVPPGGPRITPYPTLPPGAPLWGGRVALIPKQNEWDYPPISEEIKNDCHRGLSTNIYCEAVLSNRNRDDGRQLGAAAAMLYHKGRENGHAAKVFGEELTIADIWTRALTPALNTITAHLSNKPAQLQESFKILLPSNPALCRALDPSAHEEQAASLSHLEKLGELLTTHPNIDVTLQWLPKKIHFGGFRRAKQKALRAILLANPADLEEEPPSIKKLKETAKDSAIAAWAEKWHLAPRTSLAYCTALRSPPDGRAHLTFHPERAINRRPEQIRGEKKLIKFSRLTHSTFYRFVTGHAFTGEYTQRFYPPTHRTNSPAHVASQSKRSNMCCCTAQITTTHAGCICLLKAGPEPFHSSSTSRTASSGRSASSRRRVPARNHGKDGNQDKGLHSIRGWHKARDYHT